MQKDPIHRITHRETTHLLPHLLDDAGAIDPQDERKDVRRASGDPALGDRPIERVDRGGPQGDEHLVGRRARHG